MSAVNRRDFLGRAAVSSAAMGLTAAVAAAAEEKAKPAEVKEKPAESAGRKIVIGVMGMGGRGTELACQLQKLPETEVAYVCCADKRAWKPRPRRSRRCRQVAQDGRRLPPHPRRQGGRRPGRRRARPLARPGNDPRLRGRQARLRREALLPQSSRGRAANRRRAQAQARGADGHAAAELAGPDRGHAEAPRRGGRPRHLRPRVVHQRAAAASAAAKPAPVPEWLDYELWQGPAPRRPFRSNFLHYNWHWFWHWGTARSATTASTGSIWPAGAWASIIPRRVTSGGGRYCFDDDQETPDTQIVSFEFGDKLLTWECRSCLPRGIEGEGFGAAFYGDSGHAPADGQQVGHLRPQEQARRREEWQRRRRRSPGQLPLRHPHRHAPQRRDRDRLQEHPPLPPRRHLPPRRPRPAPATRPTATSSTTPPP